MELAEGAAAGGTGAKRRISTLETVPLASKDRRVVWTTTNHIEAPNWSRDGAFLVFNSRGRLYRIPVGGGSPTVIDTGFAIRCNNDHGISPDGTQLVIGDQSQPDRKSRIYTLPLAGVSRGLWSRRPGPPIGTGGHPTAGRWPTAPSAGGNTMCTRFLWRVERSGG